MPGLTAHLTAKAAEPCRPRRKNAEIDGYKRIYFLTAPKIKSQHSVYLFTALLTAYDCDRIEGYV